MTEQAAALADKGDAVVDAAQRLARVQHVQHHAVDVVGDAEAIGPDHGEPRGPRGGCDGVLRGVIADLGEARGEHHGRADLAAGASFYGLRARWRPAA